MSHTDSIPSSPSSTNTTMEVCAFPSIFMLRYNYSRGILSHLRMPNICCSKLRYDSMRPGSPVSMLRYKHTKLHKLCRELLKKSKMLTLTWARPYIFFGCKAFQSIFVGTHITSKLTKVRMLKLKNIILTQMTLDCLSTYIPGQGYIQFTID